MSKRILSEDEIIDALCYFVLPHERTEEKLASMFKNIVLAAREIGFDMSPEYYASKTSEVLKKMSFKAWMASRTYGGTHSWTGENGIINKVKPLKYEQKVLYLLAYHEHYCIKAELATRSRGCGLVSGRA